MVLSLRFTIDFLKTNFPLGSMEFFLVFLTILLALLNGRLKGIGHPIFGASGRYSQGSILLKGLAGEKIECTSWEKKEAHKPGEPVNPLRG